MSILNFKNVTELKDFMKKNLYKNIKVPEDMLTETELQGICAACNGWLFSHRNNKQDIVEHLREYRYYKKGEAKQFWPTDAALEKTIYKLMYAYYTPTQIFLYVMAYWDAMSFPNRLIEFLTMDVLYN